MLSAGTHGLFIASGTGVRVCLPVETGTGWSGSITVVVSESMALSTRATTRESNSSIVLILRSRFCACETSSMASTCRYIRSWVCSALIAASALPS